VGRVCPRHNRLWPAAQQSVRRRQSNVASDFELTNQLYGFMQSIPVLWTWDELAELHIREEQHTEQRGPASRPMTFDLTVVENDVKHGRTYLHVLVSVSDPARKKEAKRGSSWTPLTTSFLWYRDGELDMPSAREIYERPY
jgi:hypothetical protein